ncbi:MAG: hypothetical protein IJ761_01195 [Bacteroidales bacterium]|nr:hypothetical protein [Bacteroidales bacterium]
MEQLPSLISTLGVLGTFLGITIGLLGFNTANIEGSIPQLLNGLKTAFFTSLAGMFGSMALSTQVNDAFDKTEKGMSDASMAAATIVQAINSLETILKNQVPDINNIRTTINSIQSSSSSINTHLRTLNAQILTIAENTTDVLQNVITVSTNLATKEDVLLIKDSVSSIETVLSGAMISKIDDTNTRMDKISEQIHAEAENIERSMNETNNLLSLKFDEFTELLKKSNTEALVEVMKRVTEEFQKQMGELINKLVQENFDQLNKSVEQLNTWQVQNKEMITSLTQQYKEMTNQFEHTSTTLQKVGDDTNHLVSDGSKLRQIIDALNKVMIDDERFVQVTTNLTESSNLAKDSMQAFNESTQTLNNWVRKQRQFVDAVNELILKLDEINKINDYSEEFWQDTRRGLNDAVASIRGTVDGLNNEISDLDQHFYQRLNATLSELDTCMQALINGRR